MYRPATFCVVRPRDDAPCVRRKSDTADVFVSLKAHGESSNCSTGGQITEPEGLPCLMFETSLSIRRHRRVREGKLFFAGVGQFGARGDFPDTERLARYPARQPAEPGHQALPNWGKG